MEHDSIPGAVDNSSGALPPEGSAAPPAAGGNDDVALEPNFEDESAQAKGYRDARAGMQKAQQELADMKAQVAANALKNEVLNDVGQMIQANNAPSYEEQQQRIYDEWNPLFEEDPTKAAIEMFQKAIDPLIQEVDGLKRDNEALRSTVQTRVDTLDPAYREHKEQIDAFARKHGVPIAKATEMMGDFLGSQGPQIAPASQSPGNSQGNGGVGAPAQGELQAKNEAYIAANFSKEEIAEYEREQRANRS